MNAWSFTISFKIYYFIFVFLPIQWKGQSKWQHLHGRNWHWERWVTWLSLGAKTWYHLVSHLVPFSSTSSVSTTTYFHFLHLRSIIPKNSNSKCILWTIHEEHAVFVHMKSLYMYVCLYVICGGNINFESDSCYVIMN